MTTAGHARAAPSAEEELTAALVQAIDREHALRSLAGLVLSSLEDDLPVEAVLRRLLEEGVMLLSAEGGAYVEGESVECVGRLATSDDPVAILGGLAPDPGSEVTVHLGRSGRRLAMLLGDPSEDTLRGILFCRTDGSAFSTGEVGLASTVGVAARLVRSVNRMRAEAIDRARATRELEAAAALAQSSLQRTLPEVAGLGISARSVPAREAGGDFYLCEATGDRLWAVVGDVAGKGLPAATVMTKALAATRVAIARADAAAEPDPAEVLAAVGAELFDYLAQVGLFVTAVAAVVDPATGTLSIANAGHTPVLLAQRDGARPVPASCPPLGVLPSISPKVLTSSFDEGDVLLLGSDGLVEQEDGRGRMLGQDLLAELLATLRGRDAETARRLVEAQVDTWRAGREQGDDTTLMVLVRGDSAPHLEVEPTAADVRRVGPWLAEVLETVPADEAAVLQGRLELALHEVCMNVVDHGRLPEGARMALEARIGEDDVTVTVRDAGVEVDLAAVPEPVAGQPQVRGYGVMIARQLLDVLELEREEREDGPGNRWRLVVRRSRADSVDHSATGGTSSSSTEGTDA